MRRHLLSVAAVVGAVLLAYSNAPKNGFVWDDHIYVEENPFVKDPANLMVLLSPRYYLGATDVLLASRPVFLATLLADRALWGDRPAGYHAASVLLHAANSAWVYALSAALGLAPAQALGAALVFGLHPLQTEAVDGVSFRPDLLAAFFVFAGLWVYLRSRRRAPALAAASALLFGLGLLSKEMAAVLPLLIVFAEVFFPAAKDRAPRLAAALASYFLVACAFAGFWSSRFAYSGLGPPSAARQALDRVASAMPTAPGPSRLPSAAQKGHLLAPASSEWAALYADGAARSATMTGALAGYLRLMVFPYPLAADRAPVVLPGWTPRAWAALAALILAAAMAAALRRARPALAFGLSWCLAALLPVSGVIPLFNPMAERYPYLAVAGFSWAAASALSRRKPAKLLACAVLAVFALLTHERTRAWENERTLFLDSDPRVPQGSRASFIRASLLKGEGRASEAAREFEAAVAKNPAFTEAWVGLGEAYAGAGDLVRADASYRKALEVEPANAVLRFAYGLFLARIGQSSRAAEQYRRATAIEPRYVEAWVNLGSLYRGAGRYAEARGAYQAAVALAAPRDPIPFYSYAALLEKTGDLEGAAAQYRAALKRDPDFKSAHLRLGKLYARLGRKKESFEELNRAAGN